MFTARVEAVGHDGHNTAAVLQGSECSHEMTMRGERILGAGSIAGEWRIHDHYGRPHGNMLVNLRGVEGGDAAFGEEISKNCGSNLDRKSVVSGQGVSVRVDTGGGGI